MFTWIWIPATVAASVLQVARNALQRGLLPKSGPWAATLVRFLFGLPFAVVFAFVAHALTPGAAAHFTPLFWWAAISGAISQVVATAALLVAMRRAGFAVGTSMQQSSLPLAAIIGLAVFHDQLSAIAWSGVAVTTAALVVLTWPRESGGPQPISGGAFGVLSGLTFGYALNAYRQAAVQFDPGHPIFAAVSTVSVTQAMQTVGLSLLLAIWDRAALKSVFIAWRASLGAGLCGALASSCWLTALALTPAAPVRALGVIEAPVAALAGRRMFRERLSALQWIAGALVAAGVAMTALG
ncbi:MAG TPA: DMT family transporter [Caulobacteraceae bacterium]|nr:DMT family transporter [Caulobacteraceae bacterium]